MHWPINYYRILSVFSSIYFANFTTKILFLESDNVCRSPSLKALYLLN